MNPAKNPNTPRRSTHTRLSEFSRRDNKRQTELRRVWFAEGRCPNCGEMGEFVGLGPVCSLHGPYSFVPLPSELDGFDEREVLPDE